MKLFTRIATVSVLLPLVISVSVHAQKKKPEKPPETQEDDVVRVDTTLVVLPVRVSDRHGKFLPGLAQQQFQVYEDGIEQDIVYFEPPADGANSTIGSSLKPLTVALMLDVSDSTQFKLEQIQKTAVAFVDLLRSGDRVMVVAFDKGVQILAEPTADRNVLREAIRRARAGGGTSLYQALDLTIDKLNRLGGRKAIVLLTDGVDTSSKGITSDNTIRAAEHSYISIYPIQYQTYGDFADSPSRETSAAGEFGKIAHVTKTGEPASEAYKRATRYLRLLADKTSGHFQYSDGPKNLAGSFERIAAQLRQQYTLGYYPKNKSGTAKPRKINVTVVMPKVSVETRKSYIYKPAGN
jgi:Ca-activated chloride channel family protein